MKRRYQTFIALTGLLASAFTFATTPAENKGYFSSLQPNRAALTKKALTHAPTNITLINATHYIVYLNVPNTPVNDTVYPGPGTNDHIYNVFGAFDTTVIIRDPNYNIFFTSTVCPFAIVSIFGGPGGYLVNVDNDLC